jgi:hypothetical protein
MAEIMMMWTPTTSVTGRIDSSGRVASLFSLFWCLDAKGGEVVLLGVLRDLHGWKHKLARLSFFGACVSSYFICLKFGTLCG